MSIASVGMFLAIMRVTAADSAVPSEKSAASATDDEDTQGVWHE